MVFMNWVAAVSIDCCWLGPGWPEACDSAPGSAAPDRPSKVAKPPPEAAA